MGNYNRYRRGRTGEPTKLLTAGQLRQIETAFQELEHKATQCESRARQWQKAAAEAQAQAAQWEARAKELQKVAASAQVESAQTESKNDEWMAEAKAAQAKVIEWEAKASQLASAAAQAEELAIEREDALRSIEERFALEQADFQDSRQRLSRRFAAEAEEEKMAFARDLLPVLDNLERAIEHAPPAGDASTSLIQGVDLTRRAFQDVMARYGVLPYEAANQPFDPAVHEAVGTIPDRALPPGTVASVEEKGYKYQDKLLRPARVLITPFE